MMEQSMNYQSIFYYSTQGNATFFKTEMGIAHFARPTQTNVYRNSNMTVFGKQCLCIYKDDFRLLGSNPKPCEQPTCVGWLCGKTAACAVRTAYRNFTNGGFLFGGNRRL
jgi:hypothetical protein